MSGVAFTRDAAAIVAAAGIVALLVHLPGIPALARRSAGLVAVVGAWVALAATLVPSDDTIGDRLGSPVGVAATLVATGILLAVLWFAAREILRRPVVWFVALGLVLPLRVPIPLGGEDRNLLLPLYLVIAAGVVAMVVGWWSGARPAEAGTPLDLPLAAFAGFTMLSATWSVDGEEAAVKLVFFYIPFALLYLAVVALWRRSVVPTLAATTVALSLPIAAIAMWQYQARDIFLNDRLETANTYGQFFRANSVFFDPNILGRFLAIAIVILVAWAWLRPTRRTIATCAVLTVPLLGGLAVTFSRSSCLMLMTALAFMAWRAFGGRRTLAVGGVTLLLLSAAAMVTSGNVRRAATDAERLERVSEGRFDLIRGGVNIWEQSPVRGAGVGGFATRYERTLTPAEQRRVRVVISHNTPVTILSELGAVGLGLFAWLAVGLWRPVMAGARRATEYASFAAWTLLGLATGILVHSLFYAGFFEDPYIWVIAAAALAMTGGIDPPVDDTA